MIRKHTMKEAERIINDEDLNLKDYEFFGDFLKKEMRFFSFLSDNQIEEIQNSIEKHYLKKALKGKDYTIHSPWKLTQYELFDFREIIENISEERYSRNLWYMRTLERLIMTLEIYADYVLNFNDRDYYSSKLISELKGIDKEIMKVYKQEGVYMESTERSNKFSKRKMRENTLRNRFKESRTHKGIPLEDFLKIDLRGPDNIKVISNGHNIGVSYSWSELESLVEMDSFLVSKIDFKKDETVLYLEYVNID